MSTRGRMAGWWLGLALVPTLAWSACPPSCPLPGGGSPQDDCHAEFASTALRLNFPPYDPAKPKPASEVRCFDGDAGCDTDDSVNRVCRFDVDVCLRNADPALPCTPADVTSVKVSGGHDPDLKALAAALGALVPATANVCTSGRTLRVPLKGRPGHLRPGSKTVALKARTAAGTDSDGVTFTCVPHDWPFFGYDHANRRASGVETVLGPANAAKLVQKWDLDLKAREGTGDNGVTSTPTVGNGVVYVTSWNGKVYAVKASNGKVKWTYDTKASFMGVQSSATLTADGRLVVGDSVGVIHCLLAKTGKLLWQTSLDQKLCNGDLGIVCGGDADCGSNGPCIQTDQVWASPTVANGRVFIGLASHSDQPCNPGRLIALDLDTGKPLWTHVTVPGRICTSDTTVACTSDADCGAGKCVAAIGAGVTATVSVDASGETVYMGTVGCYTFPSVGDSESLFRLDAATGTLAWKRRLQPGEQFGYCSTDGSDCATDATCGAGTCTTKTLYHDFGFLNGPLLVDIDDGHGGTRNVVFAGGKEGTLYALDPATGSTVWTRVVLPPPVSPAYAGYGLFNAAIGFSNHRFFAGLNEFGPPVVPAPDHLQAFSAVDGSTIWHDDIGIGFGSMAIAGGLVFVGNQVTTEFFVYDAATGKRLKTFTVPANIASGASIVDGTVYVGYGVYGGEGGVRAFGLPKRGH
jgi:outer membrane protein assembly factor BamB